PLPPPTPAAIPRPVPRHPKHSASSTGDSGFRAVVHVPVQRPLPAVSPTAGGPGWPEQPPPQIPADLCRVPGYRARLLPEDLRSSESSSLIDPVDSSGHFQNAGDPGVIPVGLGEAPSPVAEGASTPVIGWLCQHMALGALIAFHAKIKERAVDVVDGCPPFGAVNTSFNDGILASGKVPGAGQAYLGVI